MWPKEIVSYQTSDLELHRSKSAAEYHQRRIDGSALATKMLDEGASVGAAMRAGELLPDGCYPELDEVFASTKLIISHWQCRDTPGYSPVRFEIDGGIFVFGDAGSWSGPWGSVVSCQDLVRYWLDTKRRTTASGGSK